MTTMAYFHPYVHAWHFHSHKQLVLADFNNDSSEYYLCQSSGIHLKGGMVTLALDNYFSGIGISRQTHFPATGNSLQQQFLSRHKALFNENDLWKEFGIFASRPDHPGIISPHTIGFESKKQWRNDINPSLDNGVPIPMGVVISEGYWSIVLVYGYELDATSGIVKLFIYDPDWPDFHSPSSDSSWGARVNSIESIEFDLDEPENQINANMFIHSISYPTSIRGFFHLKHPGETKKGDINYLRLRSLNLLEPEAYGFGDQRQRRERFRMVVSMNTNIIPYFDVKKEGDDGEYHDEVTNEIMRPHACDTLQGVQTLDLSYLDLPRTGEEWEMHIHVSLDDQHDEASVIVPASRIRFMLYLHSPQPFSSYLQGSGPVDVLLEDVTVVEENISESTIAALSNRIIYIKIPPEGSGSSGVPQIFVGFNISYHLGYITKPIYCKVWLERMVEPTTIEISESYTAYIEITPENREKYELRSGYSSYDYMLNLEIKFYLQAVDYSIIVVNNVIQLYAKRLLAFYQPEYRDVPNWDKLETLRDRIHEYIDRELLKEWIEKLVGSDLAWINKNQKVFLSSVGEECMRILKEPALADALTKQINDTNELYLGIINHQMNLTRKQEIGERQTKPAVNKEFERDLLEQYNEHILSIFIQKIPVMLDNQTILEDVLRKLKGKIRPKKEVSTKRKSKPKKG